MADLSVTETQCTRLEYLTQARGWVPIEGQAPPMAITRPAGHDWGRWNLLSGPNRVRVCKACGVRSSMNGTPYRVLDGLDTETVPSPRATNEEERP